MSDGLTFRQRSGLTPLQVEVLAFIVGRIKDGQPSPTLREIGEAIGLGGKGRVHAILVALEERGKIIRHTARARGILLPEHDEPAFDDETREEIVAFARAEGVEFPEAVRLLVEWGLEAALGRDAAA